MSMGHLHCLTLPLVTMSSKSDMVPAQLYKEQLAQRMSVKDSGLYIYSRKLQRQ
jgi:hypothetical protein